ncbi:MAG: hypothetical protein ABIL09_22865 [Gemmatimonadota bacterium]
MLLLAAVPTSATPAGPEAPASPEAPQETAQSAVRTFVLGDLEHPWERGGDGTDPALLPRMFARSVQFGNAPGGDIGYDHPLGWIGPTYYDGSDNLAPLVLGRGSIRSPNTMDVYSRVLRDQLTGTVNGDHSVAFERKPTPLDPTIAVYGIWVILDFGRPVAVDRILFYPRADYRSDYLRAYEVWLNDRQTNSAEGAPDALLARVTDNAQPLVDLPVRPQNVRLIKLRSLTERPFEIDEIEVYGTGYLTQASYYSDLIDLGGRATVGPISWVSRPDGDSLYSRLAVQVRTGMDDTPIHAIRRAWEEQVPGQPVPYYEIPIQEYLALPNIEKLPLTEDDENWSPWHSLATGALPTAPAPRRYIQFQLRFDGRLEDARQVDRLSFPYLSPPVADVLRAEIYPRLAQAEQPATFRYAVLLRSYGAVRGYDRLQVDTVIPAANVRGVLLNGVPVDFTVASLDDDSFVLGLPLVARDGALLELTFDMPIFRFGTTFSGRAWNSRYPGVPQALESGQAIDFGPGDEREVSGLAVAIPREQIGKLVGQISVAPRPFTPNGDGVNDELTVYFNLLQLVATAPVRLELYDLSGRRLHVLYAAECGIGPVTCTWNGRLADGSLVRPGNYLWLLRIDSDAFEERHTGLLAVAY